MDYNYLREDSAFHEWHKYTPLDTQYIKYAKSNPSLIAACHKIEDVYYAYCSARASFMFANSENFGDISGTNETSKLYAKTHFLTNALLEYAICLDISWQVVWAYIQPSSLEYLMNQKYKDMEKECTRDSVLAQLKCVISQNSFGVSIAQKLLELINQFDNDEDTLKLRSIYNGIKHQGIIHYEGLGANFSEISISINGKMPPMLHRKSYTVEYIEELMLSYHKKFKLYMDEIISIIIPEGYLETTVPFEKAIAEIIKMNKATE
ncbi:MAG: hypothetical protein IJO36_03885 [Clostridia bacterium]|nr:hypothetical protein [Clostridia bacterium]